MTPMIDHECNCDFYQTPVAATHKRAKFSQNVSDWLWHHLSSWLWHSIQTFVVVCKVSIQFKHYK